MVFALVAATAALSGSPPALPLKPCVLQGSVGARCGTLAVPEDRRRPLGRKIRVFVGVVPAYGRKPHAEPVVWLSGGPGGAAASDDARFASTTLFAANERRDLVLVDQRGVGRSAPLVCPRPPAGEVDALAYARSCLRTVGRDPRLYTTDAAMDDVDAVRKALGYRKIVLFGGSYGATAAQVYLARHRATVAAAVLDGATLLDVPIWERMPRSTQQAFDALAARCARTARCSAAFPDVRLDWHAVLARLRAAPVDVPIAIGTIRFGVADAQSTVRLLLREPASSARVPLILHRAAAGDLTGLVTPWLESRPNDERTARKLMYWAIRCAEGWSRLDPAEVARVGEGTDFLEASLADAETMPVVCGLLGRPLPAPDTAVVPRSRVPVLFLVGGMDPQDPLPNVANARRSLPNAQTLVVAGAGHGSLQHGCLPDVAARFFSRHRLSAADRTCAARIQPPPFAIS